MTRHNAGSPCPQSPEHGPLLLMSSGRLLCPHQRHQGLGLYTLDLAPVPAPRTTALPLLDGGSTAPRIRHGEPSSEASGPDTPPHAVGAMPSAASPVAIPPAAGAYHTTTASPSPGDPHRSGLRTADAGTPLSLGLL